MLKKITRITIALFAALSGTVTIFTVCASAAWEVLSHAATGFAYLLELIVQYCDATIEWLDDDDDDDDDDKKGTI